MAGNGESRTLSVSIGARVFVTAVFVALGLSFFVETGNLAVEFRADGLWLDLASFYSQNFLFFPVAGTLVLVAFWRPACLVVDAYARGVVGFGRLILAVGFVLAGVGSWQLSDLFARAPDRSLFEVAPAQLAADKGGEELCGGQACPRAPVLTALREVRLAAARQTLSDVTGRCGPTRTTFLDEEDGRQPYCFVSGQRMASEACCQARANFIGAVNALHASEASRAAQVHRLGLPLKVFFLLILVGVGVMLARRRKRLERLYGREMDAFDLSLPLGALIMMIWPVTNSAFTHSYDALFGDGSGGSTYRVLAPLYSLGFMVWALALVFYYLRKFGERAEATAQAAGVGVAVVGVVQYDSLVGYVNKTIGAGASVSSLIVFAVGLWLVAWVVMLHDDDEVEGAGTPRG